MVHLRRSGNVNYLRVHNRGGYGPGDDHLTEEVIGGLDSAGSHRFGISLRDDDDLPANQAMFQLLRDGLGHDVETTVEYEIDRSTPREDGSDRTNGTAFRVELRPKS
jgi:hypothetical protein